MKLARAALASLSYVSLASLAACGSNGDGSHFLDVDAGEGGGASGGDGASAGLDGGTLGDASFATDSAANDAGAKVGEVYAHSADTLYKLEPYSKVTTVIGPFRGCAGQVIDIALDKNGQMYGTTFSSLEKIDKATAQCVTVAQGAYPNSLTFVPVGTLDANAEALVGFEGDQYVRIDTTSGQKTTVGSLNPNATGKTYVSSGDVVSIIGDKTYLTVKVTPSMNADALIEVDPKTGKALKLIGSTGQQDIFGLAYWAGTAYGFTNSGLIFALDLTTGQSTNIPIPGAPPGLSFWGAGVTTAAPTVVPK
jgi:hypothetical protein